MVDVIIVEGFTPPLLPRGPADERPDRLLVEAALGDLRERHRPSARADRALRDAFALGWRIAIALERAGREKRRG